ncbi:lasso peptide biosynthesis B2 protein [uncultured Phenylobacterium sp.]|uniref:lasso peptide biosynthesis B2 protein n=1 Tax=uncultured Phenylobacterium sp. TaxID=349273 RepID=UPI0025F71BF2|nr:lasso peptide biosynthesis B2 protein [uncultured Phenylobacterium sp.]
MLTISLEPAVRASWALADNVHATAVDDDLVFLDVSTDAYLCVPGGAADLQIADDGATLRISSTELADDLQAAGLVQRLSGGPPAAPRRKAWPPTDSALERAYCPPTWRDAPVAAAAVLDVALAYRSHSLSQIVSRTVAPRARLATSTLEETLNRFQRWIPYAPVSGKCLLRSFMLRRVLQQHGHPHDWVFGVTVWPFKAHCWLQAESLVLDDTAENVVAYRPIMVV